MLISKISIWQPRSEVCHRNRKIFSYPITIRTVMREIQIGKIFRVDQYCGLFLFLLFLTSVYEVDALFIWKSNSSVQVEKTCLIKTSASIR